jgi:hypothetical protein
VLRGLGQETDLHFGVYAEVLVPGMIKHDDPVVVAT